MLIFELLNVSFYGVPDVCGDKPFVPAKLLQKPIYIQILRFIFAFCKMLIYNTLVK